jgi:hypothetical protein
LPDVGADLGVTFVIGLGVADQKDLVKSAVLIQIGGDGFPSDLASLFERVSIDSGADARESYGAKVPCRSQPETVAVAVG